MYPLSIAEIDDSTDKDIDDTIDKVIDDTIDKDLNLDTSGGITVKDYEFR